MAIGNPVTLTSNVSSKTITTTATAGQTIFTISGGYRINQISVFRNGVKLATDDYQARDGSTVTLTVGANAGDTLEFQIFDDFRVANALDVNAGGTISGSINVNGSVTATSFAGNVTGTATTALGLSGTPDITVGIITATSFRGDGSLLSNINAGYKRILSVGVSTTLQSGDFCYVNTQGLTITLPATPSVGNQVTINVGNFQNTILGRNGSNIQALSENMTINIANATVDLIYLDATQGWRII